ncbi:hypothetical protein BASA83_001171 [Batrachochytrium salamandrivorans]|nr:hypothetical protein BASA62_003859 [Batrachochytrium salamandrivorans]KAH9276472.1 hypothetical protein BASA83_001171 [Batrachochytrium salamandrivorans]
MSSNKEMKKFTKKSHSSNKTVTPKANPTAPTSSKTSITIPPNTDVPLNELAKMPMSAQKAIACQKLSLMFHNLRVHTHPEHMGPNCCKWSTKSLKAPTIQQRLELGPLQPGLWVTCDGSKIVELYVDGESEYSLQGTLADVELLEAFPSLRLLVLTNHRNLTGSIPDMSNLVELQHLDLHGNSHVGALPASLANANTLRHLDLSSTMLSGDIPWDIEASFPTLSYINLSNTFVSDSIPDLSNMRGLKTCNLAGLHMCVPTTYRPGVICSNNVQPCREHDPRLDVSWAEVDGSNQYSDNSSFSSILVAGLVVVCLTIVAIAGFLVYRFVCRRGRRNPPRRNPSLDMDLISDEIMADSNIKDMHYGAFNKIARRDTLSKKDRNTVPADLDYTNALERMHELLIHTQKYNWQQRQYQSTYIINDLTPMDDYRVPRAALMRRENSIVTFSSHNSAGYGCDGYRSHFSDDYRVNLRFQILEQQLMGSMTETNIVQHFSHDVRNYPTSPTRDSIDSSLWCNTTTVNNVGWDLGIQRLLSQSLSDLLSDSSALHQYLNSLIVAAKRRDLNIILRNECLDRLEEYLNLDTREIKGSEELQNQDGSDVCRSPDTSKPSQSLSWKPQLMICDDGYLDHCKFSLESPLHDYE